MSQLQKIHGLKRLITEHAQSLLLLLKQGKGSVAYVIADDAFWDYIQHIGYTAEDVAVAYDWFYCCKLGDHYTWADWMGLYNQCKNQLLDAYGVELHIGDFEQSALDIVKAYYVQANKG